MGGLLILLSLATGIAALIALIRPLPGLYLPTRKRAGSCNEGVYTHECQKLIPVVFSRGSLRSR